MLHHYGLIACASLSSLLPLASQLLSHARNGESKRIPEEAFPIPNHKSDTVQEARSVGGHIAGTEFTGEQRMSQVFEKSIDAIIIMDTEGKITDANAAALRLVEAVGKGELVGRDCFDFIAPHDQAHVRNGLRKAADTGAVRDQRYDFLTVRGAMVPVEGNVITMTTQAGEAVGYIGIARDITERLRADEALQESGERYRALVENATDLIYMIGRDLTVLSMNTAAAAFLGRQPDQTTGKSLFDIFPKTVVAGYAANIERVFVSGESHSVEELLVSKDRNLWTIVNFNPVKDAAGHVVAVMGVGRDITDRKAAEEMLRRSERELAVRNRIANVFLTRTDEGTYGDVLAAVLEALESTHGVFGYISDDGDLVCPSLTRDVWEQCGISDKTMVFRRPEWKGIWGRALVERKTFCSNSLLKTPPGHIPVSRAVAVPLIHQGCVIGLLMVGNRKTDYDDASIRLLETLADKVAPILGARLQGDREERQRKALEKEKESLQEQLMQSQKLEAIGMLAAGVAHDFNNVLSSIIGYCDIALLKTAPEMALHKELKYIQEAAVRGAGLTRQLLLFARRHPAEVALLETSHVISDTLEMLDRLVGDDITIDARVDPGLWMIRGDQTGIQQAITNVVVNARDAMPGGGRISLVAENVVIPPGHSEISARARPGEYVRISVADQGAGMDEVTINRVFEPFFTTKEMERGTGLGLSVVHGVVTQHGGWINVESTPGVGSTFNLYFGAANEPVSQGEEGAVSEDLEAAAAGVSHSR